MQQQTSVLQDDGSPPPVPAAGERSIACLPVLDAIVELSANSDNDRQVITAFLSTQGMREIFEGWLSRFPGTVKDLATACRVVERAIAEMDRMLAEQLNAILHHPKFQQLEASWRGVMHLVETADSWRDSLENEPSRGGIVVRLLNVSKSELQKDTQRAIEFDRGCVFEKVYEQEFGMAGGNPYGLLVADYTFSHHPDDLELLASLSGVAAAAFAPLITGASPELLGLDDYSTLEQPLDFSAILARPDYIKWRTLRDQLDSRFIGLTLPRILMRRPYHAGSAAAEAGFSFCEDVEDPDRSQYLWGSAAYAFATVVMRAYGNSGWFDDLRGVQRGAESGGIVVDFPSHWFATDPRGVALKIGTEVSLDTEQERELSKIGLLPLCDCNETEFTAFYTNQSLYQPKRFDDPVVTTNERMNAMLHYTLCTSRFAHYIKVLGRDKVGSVKSTKELEDELNRWLAKYVVDDDNPEPLVKARYPLRRAKVQVDDVPGKPGEYRLFIWLCTHYQLDQLQGSLRLTTRISGAA